MSNEIINNLSDFISEYRALFNAIRKVVPVSMKIYLVGGAVRDILLGRKIRDFDFSVEGLVRPIGKHIANELGGAYYVLDDEREMVRVIIDDVDLGQYDIDISLLAGESIEDDLRERDFTLNAVAIQIAAEPQIIDPLGGIEALNNRILRMCSPDSPKDDPMRAMRAVRMSLEFGLSMDDELQAEMLNCTERLNESSFERYRDELFKTVRLKQNGKALKLFEKFRLLGHLFPGYDAASLSSGIGRIENTDQFIKMMTEQNAEIELKDEFALYAAARLGNFCGAMKSFFDKPLALYHSRRMLVSFASIAALLANADTEIIKSWCSRLALSSSETNFVLSTVQAYKWLDSEKGIVSYGDVDIYRYFKQYKEGGIGGLILFLAEKYELQTGADAYKHWCERVVYTQDMISAYFGRYMDVIAPKPFLSGDDIQNLLKVQAGPVIGQLKNSLIEAQIRGAVRNIQEAELFVRQQVKNP